VLLSPEQADAEQDEELDSADSRGRPSAQAAAAQTVMLAPSLAQELEKVRLS
jgi:hypothetical protein